MHGVLIESSGAIVFSPDRADEARSQADQRGMPLVAFMPVVTTAPGWIVADGAYDRVSVTADAYASDEQMLADAISFVSKQPPAERARGPLRVTYLGSLGERRPPDGLPIGGSLPLDRPLSIGRAPRCEICLRQGGHSDQNTVARLHARIEKSPMGARIIDARSTNGTWVRGQRVDMAVIAPGDELAIACTHRFRLDGQP
jgi:hypothetical protein